MLGILVGFRSTTRSENSARLLIASKLTLGSAVSDVVSGRIPIHSHVRRPSQHSLRYHRTRTALLGAPGTSGTTDRGAASASRQRGVVVSRLPGGRYGQVTRTLSRPRQGQHHPVVLRSIHVPNLRDSLRGGHGLALPCCSDCRPSDSRS